MAPIGVAIIGGGIFAQTEHAPAVLKCNKFALKAIYSRSLKSAKETAAVVADLGGPSSLDLYSSDSDAGKTYDDLVHREDISALIIALPIVAQPEYVKKALDTGKHVLAEKPIAADVARAQDLVDHARRAAHVSPAAPTLAIAENFRFNPAYRFAADEARRLGRVTHFAARSMHYMPDDNKYYKTEWRKTPEYQGGFLLDGGVHFAALTRLFLAGEGNRALKVVAATQLAQKHLAPIDSVSAVVTTDSGATGTYQHSAGTSGSAFEWDVALEKGSVRLQREKVTVTEAGKDPVDTGFDRTSGVSEEVAAWGEALAAGKPDPRQSPEEALADLEFLEKMFRSGEAGGKQQVYELQL